MKKIDLKTFIKFAISAVLIVYLVRKIGLEKLIETITQINPYYFLIAFVFTICGFVIQVVRLGILLKSQNISISFKKIFEFNLISNFFGIFLPTVVGGDVVKMALIGSSSGKKVVSAGAVTMDRVIGSYALATVAFVAGLMGKNLLTHEIVSYTLDAFILFFVVLLILNIKSLFDRIWQAFKLDSYKWANTPKKFIETLQSFSIKDPAFRKAFMWSLLFYIAIIFSNYFIGKSLGLNINPLVFFVFVPLLSLAGMLPVSISGLGIRESVSVVFFATLGIESSFGVLLSFLPFVMKAFIGLLGGLLYLKNEITINK